MLWSPGQGRNVEDGDSEPGLEIMGDGASGTEREKGVNNRMCLLCTWKQVWSLGTL